MMARADEMQELVEEQREGESRERMLARIAIASPARHAWVTSIFASGMFDGKDVGDFTDMVAAFRERLTKCGSGDKQLSSELLASQAIVLDSIFTEMTRRAAANLGESHYAVDHYMKLALKAQANSRSTLEALTKLHQPREQIVKHVHVNEGGQAVVADEFHHHRGGGGNDQSKEQPHATGDISESTPMLGKDTAGNSMPISGGEGPEAVPNARGNKSGRSEG